MRGRSNFCHGAQELDIGWGVVEVIVRHQAAVRLAAELTVFFFVKALEQWALIPSDAFVAAHGAAQLGLADVHEADLQHFVCFGVGDQVVKTAPCRLQALKVGVVQDQVDLVAEFAVDFGNDGFNAGVGIVTHGDGIDQSLPSQRANGGFYCVALFIAFGLEFAVQQAREDTGVCELGAA